MARRWALGVDLGGTKIEIARVAEDGEVMEKLRRATEAGAGVTAIEKVIVDAARELAEKADSQPRCLGVGVAGQVDADTGTVIFGPNLDWHDVPLSDDLSRELEMPVVVTNDVRAATFAEWRHGAGAGSSDVLCLFVGTGIGGGVVSGGRLMAGCSNTAGEVGHMTVAVAGPKCTCGNTGCLEALAGGWAIARDAREAVSADPKAGAALLEAAGGATGAIDARIVAAAAEGGDPLARSLIDAATNALVAGSVSLVNGFNPCRLVLGGGIVEGIPGIVETVEREVRARALGAATRRLTVQPATLHGDAGVVGAAAYALSEAID